MSRVLGRICLLFLVSIVGLSTSSYGQFTLSGELLERGQVRNGARRLPSPTDDPAIYLTQRTRINADFGTQDFGTYFSFQDVRVWGQYDQENVGATLNVYKAYGDLYFGDRFTLRAGRQGLHYDDGYLFADPNWREAGRTHDAINLMYEDSTRSFHIGGAFNAAGQSAFAIPYTVNTYQNMQWFWGKQALGKSGHVAMIAVHRRFSGVASSPASSSITFGGEIASGVGPLSAKLVGYYQTGYARSGNELAAWFGAVRLKYALEKLTITAHAHALSGTSTEDFLAAEPTTQRNFDILYGFRHRFFGHMDYFYSTTFDPYSGLRNLMVRGEYAVLPNLNVRSDVHLFATQARMTDVVTGALLDDYLGSELDLGITYNWKPTVSFNGGYSQLWGTETLEALVGGDANETANWFYVQMYITPTFFTTKK